VPPLHLEFEGRDDIWQAAGRLFAAFGALRYTLRHRYLSPEGVTDEVLLEGLQSLEFLGAPPTGKPGAVAARVILTHDGVMVTSLTLWPDVAALRDLSDGVARRIDLRTAGPGAPVVAALRATIPAPEGKFSIGQGRQLAALDEASTLLPGAPGTDPSPTPSQGVGGDDDKARKKGGPKAPLPRKVKRRRAIAAGAAMLTVAGVLVAYVAVGVNRTRVPVAVAPVSNPAPSPTTAPQAPAPTTPKPSPTPSSPPTASFDEKTGTYSLPEPLLFETGKYALRGDAKRALTKVVSDLQSQQRYGIVRVLGYTDSTGPSSLNLRLSRRRADAVAAYLQERLDPVRFTVIPAGLGESNYIAGNSTAEDRQKNRRVEVVVPPPQTTTEAPTASAGSAPTASAGSAPTPSAT